MAKYGHLKRRPESLVLSSTEGELSGKTEEEGKNGMDGQHQTLNRRRTQSGSRDYKETSRV